MLEESYDFRPVEVQSDPASTAAALEEALTEAVRSDADFSVIHLLCHGVPEHDGPGLWALGGDGRRTEELSRWLRMAENVEPGSKSPTILLMLDLCYSGRVSAEQLRTLVRAENRRAWVLAASSHDQQAFNGRLTKAVEEVLSDFASGALKLDESMEYIPIERFCREVDRRVQVMASGEIDQRVVRPLAPIGEDLSHLRFFRNPSYDPESERARELVAPATYTLIDETADIRHFVIRAYGGDGPYGDTRLPMFTGRRAQVRHLARWLEGDGPALLVVTGKPGAGKSALLGVLACAAHPRLREESAGIWRRLQEDLPRAVPDLAVVHARRLTLGEVLSSAARQWGLNPPGLNRLWTTEALMDALNESDRSPCLILDALDEAEQPVDLVAALLPLAASTREDGRPLCRALVATREELAALPLIESAAAAGGVLDLSRVPSRQLHRDLASFVSRMLHPDSEEPWCKLPLAEAVGEAVADALLADDREWGEFLVAGLYARLLREQHQPPPDLDAAKRLGAAVPRTLDGVLELDLRWQRQQGLRQLLAALAWAEGGGMPERLLARAAGVPVSGPGGVAELLKAARFYLRRNIDREGTPVFRLFHQGLADRLRKYSELGPSRVLEFRPAHQELADRTRKHPALGPSAVLDRLLTDVLHPGRPGRWQSAEPYLLTHVARHAALAGRLDELLGDPEFLVHADPEPLADELYRGHVQHPWAVVYLTSYGAHRSAGPDERRQILAVDAARHQEHDLVRELSRNSLWQIDWTAGRPLQRNLLTTLTGHEGPVLDLAHLVLGDRDHVLTAGSDGTLRLWDLAAGIVTRTMRHGSPVECVESTVVDGDPLAFTGCKNGQLRAWDPGSGRLLWDVVGHRGGVGALALVRRRGERVLVSSGHDHMVRFWNLANGEHLAEVATQGASRLVTFTDADRGDCILAFRGGGDSDIPVAFTADGEEVTLTVDWDEDEEGLALDPRPGSRCVLVLGSERNSAYYFAGDQEGALWSGWEVVDDEHSDEIRHLAKFRQGGVDCVITASMDGTARLFDPQLQESRQVAAHTTSLTRALVATTVQGQPRLLTASEGGTVRVWDLHGDAAPQRFSGHTHAISGLAVVDGSRLASASLDGTLALWNLESGERKHVYLYYQGDELEADFPTGIAVLEAGPHPRILAACGRLGVALWDTSTADTDLADRIDDRYDSPVTVITDTRHGKTQVVSAIGPSVERQTAALIDVADADAADRLTASSEEQYDSVRLANPVTCLAVSSAHQLLAGDYYGHVWSVSLSEQSDARRLFFHGAMVRALSAVDLDGRPHALSADDAGVLRLTPLDGSPGRDLVGHTREVYAVVPVLLHNRPHALTGGRDCTMRLWDLSTGRQTAIQWFPDTVFALAVGDDGTVFAGVGPDVIRLTSEHLPLRPL